MELVKKIKIPVIADSVLSPDVYYGNNLTGIYFYTQDKNFGRITFSNLDAIRVCRGEMIPYEYDWSLHERGVWIFKIENSNWLSERYTYENIHYGDYYEFGGNVNNMLTDFNHYLFSFHDQYVEVIAKGFWFEKDNVPLFKKPLQANHPFLNLPSIEVVKFTSHNLTCQVIKSIKSNEEIIANAAYCPQKLMQFTLEIEDKASINHTLTLQYRTEKLISRLTGDFKRGVIEFNGIATFEDVKPYIEEHMLEIYLRRKKMGKIN